MTISINHFLASIFFYRIKFYNLFFLFSSPLSTSLSLFQWQQLFCQKISVKINTKFYIAFNILNPNYLGLEVGAMTFLSTYTRHLLRDHS